MNDVLLIILPLVLILLLYVVQISRAGGTSQWAERWREQAEAQGGVPKVLMRTVLTVLALSLVWALIDYLGR